MFVLIYTHFIIIQYSDVYIELILIFGNKVYHNIQETRNELTKKFQNPSAIDTRAGCFGLHFQDNLYRRCHFYCQ